MSLCGAGEAWGAHNPQVGGSKPSEAMIFFVHFTFKFAMEYSKPHYQEWFKDGMLHRDDDLPAVIDAYGYQAWYKHGKRHRDGDLPAVLCADGSMQWWKEGTIHRDGDLPACIYADGCQKWCVEGSIHREGDLPAVVYADGGRQWFKNNKRHRDGDLPAVVYADTNRDWFKDDQRHRDIGPARIYPPRFYEHGMPRRVCAIRGETVVSMSPASWSPVLCFM